VRIPPFSGKKRVGQGSVRFQELQRLFSLFEAVKQCFTGKNNVWREETLFGLKKQCLKPPNNVWEEKTLFEPNKQCFRASSSGTARFPDFAPPQVASFASLRLPGVVPAP
jgi:hypothetical protein